MLVQSNGSTKLAHIEGVTRPDAYATNAGHASYSNIVVTGLKGDKPAPLAQWRVLKSTKKTVPRMSPTNGDKPAIDPKEIVANAEPIATPLEVTLDCAEVATESRRSLVEEDSGNLAPVTIENSSRKTLIESSIVQSDVVKTGEVPRPECTTPCDTSAGQGPTTR